MQFLTSRPVWVLVLLLGLFTLLAMAGPLLVRRGVALERLRTNNEVAGFKFAVIGVLYAVLLAFIVIIAWERFHDAERALAAEAGAAGAIHRLATGLGAASAAEVRGHTAAYLQSVLADEWPAMSHGHSSPATAQALSGLYEAVVQNRPADLHDADLQADLFRQLDELTAARRDRLVMAGGTVPGVIWFVVFLGAVLTILFTCFFGSRYVVMQSLMTGVLAAIIFSAILVVVAIDQPFTGAIVVDQQPLHAVLEELRDSHP
jgi:Na+/proline symporter